MRRFEGVSDCAIRLPSVWPPPPPPTGPPPFSPVNWNDAEEGVVCCCWRIPFVGRDGVNVKSGPFGFEFELPKLKLVLALKLNEDSAGFCVVSPLPNWNGTGLVGCGCCCCWVCPNPNPVLVDVEDPNVKAVGGLFSVEAVLLVDGVFPKLKLVGFEAPNMLAGGAAELFAEDAPNIGAVDVVSVGLFPNPMKRLVEDDEVVIVDCWGVDGAGVLFFAAVKPNLNKLVFEGDGSVGFFEP